MNTLHRATWRALFLFAALPVVLTPALAAARQYAPSAAKARPGVVAVALKNPLPPAAALNRTGSTALDQAMTRLNIHTLEPLAAAVPASLRKSGRSSRLDHLCYAWYSGDRAPEEVAAELRRLPEVEFAEAKYYSTLTAVPNDPLAHQQYHLVKTSLPQAWDIAKSEQREVIVAIIDGGTDITHPDLRANLWTNPGEIPGNNIDDDNNGYVDDLHGWNFADNSANPASLFSGTLYSDHGTHTAGLACAVTNNNLGIAGTSWNARLMALNAGTKTSDSAIDPLNIDKAILYAVTQGARVISCSFSGSYSELTLSLIQHAVEQGAVLVAATGNGHTLADTVFPASFPDVLAVAATDSSDRKPWFSNYGATVDVTAPGVDILSTVSAGYSGSWSGTSMSTPITAGIVALVLSYHPEWSGLQAAEQVRVTSDDIEARQLSVYGTSIKGLLGHGRVNAWRALTEESPAVRIASAGFIDQDQDHLIKPGESIQINLTLINHLARTRTLTLELTEESPYITLTRSSASTGAIGTGEKVALDKLFAFKVADNAPSGHPINFTLRLSDGEYQDTDRFTLTVLPAYADIDINNIASTITNLGRIGFVNPGGGGEGVGFRYKSAASLLFEGAVIVGTAPNRIVNAARGLILSDGSQGNDSDFSVSEGGDVRLITPGLQSDQESLAIYTDSGSSTPLNLRITQETFAWNQPAHADMILFRFHIQNLNSESLANFHFGLFFDWDMDGSSYTTNSTRFDEDRRMAYACDTGSGPDTYVGVRLLTPGGISSRGIVNDPNDPFSNGWGLHDGFTDAEKWTAISGGTSQSQAGPADISQVIASGPHTLDGGGALTLDFALLAGDNASQLFAAADSARVLWESRFTTGVPPSPGESLPEQFTLAANYPNPFNDGTRIEYSLPREADVRLDLFDLNGRLVKTLIDARQPAGWQQIRWDGRRQNGAPAASGTYFCRLQAGGETFIRPLLLLR